MEYTNMGIIFIVKHFKQIAMRVKPQVDIAVTGVRALNRAVIAGIYERMANIGFAHAVPESRLFELNFNAPLFNIASMKRECKQAGKIACPLLIINCIRVVLLLPKMAYNGRICLPILSSTRLLSGMALPRKIYVVPLTAPNMKAP
jgi:hypothetical protein